MKNKPSRHKETNTFKFKRFSERVSEIDVDVFHRVAHRYEEQSGDAPETFFYQTLQKWNDLNLTEGYTAFKKEVRNIVTLPQLLNRKQEVIDILMRYLKAKDNKPYLQPILALIVAVARDLQKEFDEYFPDFLTAIKDLLQTKDAEQLELAFTTLAYLFKFLWRYLIKNVDRTFDLLLPLLAESKPSYVNNFAAESFAYVVRKVRDRDSFFRLVLQTLQEKGQAVSGCGRLMFEVIAGTAGQFHSCAEPMLTLYLESLEDETVDRELAYRVLEKIFDCILEKIDPRKSGVLWAVLLGFVDRRTEARKSVEGKDDADASIFRLIGQLIEHRGGRMLMDPLPLVKRLVRSLEVSKDNETLLGSISDVAVAVILASSVKLNQETSSELVLKLMSIEQRNLSFRVVERLVNYSSFETLVMPQVIEKTINENFDEAALDLFAKIVFLRCPAALNGISAGWRKFGLDFRRASITTLDFLRTTLELATSEDIVSENALKVITILPHLNPLPEELFDALKASIVSTHEKLVDRTLDEDLNEKLCFLFLLAVDSAARIFEANDFHDFVDSLNGDLWKLIDKYPNSDSALNVVDLILTRVSESKRCKDTINIETFDRMNDALAAKLSAPFHKTRLIVAHVYSLFRDVPETKISPEASNNSALELMFLAENEAPTVHNYRARLVHLQALTFQSHALTNLAAKYYDFPLRYLLGNLWVNFSLLWDPVCRAIATYATKECSQFWPIFLSDLKAEIPMDDSSTNVLDASTKSTKFFESDAINSLAIKLSANEEKPDKVNYQLLLWKCMEEFVGYCETKNRDITGLFIDNVETNYFKSNTESARSWSIEKSKAEICNEAMEAEMDSDDEEEEAEEHAGEDKKNVPKGLSRKLQRSGRKFFLVKLILAQMKVFAQMSNPKMLYREAEMNRIYMDLLTSKNVEMQKAALDCLFAYKPKHLLPYKENLYSLVDEKNLKNELARFRIDQESSMLKDEDREGLMPVLMRLIYAKMVMKIGMRTGGKGGAIVRRKIILRFLAGSRESEMMIFTRMAFKPFEKFVSLDLEAPLVTLTDVVSDVASKIDLSNVIPPKRLRSAVNLLSIVIEQFGAKMMDNLLPRLLAILVCTLAQVNEILRRSENVLSGYLPTMKSLRTTCLGVAARFFTHFENYQWKADELDAFFDVGVFPLLEKLPIEGIHSPTALLKLLAAWAENPRYYKLLIKHPTGNTSLTALPYVMKLLLGPKTHGSVVSAILEMLEKMLTLRDNKMETDEEPVEPLLVTNILSVDEDTAGDMNYGSLILMPHVSDILRYMKTKLERTSKGINKTELTILSRLSELVKDPETSDKLLSLLLPILVKRTIRGETEETIVELLTTVVNLVRNVKKPEIHLRAVLPLLGCVTPVSARKLLLRLIDAIARGSCDLEIRETFEKNSNLLSKLNAWDDKWIEQPNFEKRLDAFGEIAASVRIDEGSIRLTLEFGVAVLYTCYFFLSHETDLSLRDSSGQCLKTLGPHLAKACQSNNAERRYLMDETILRLVKNGIKSKNEVVRNQSIAFLGELSLECPEVHPVLRDLSSLANRQDREVDFFENLQHLQLHRKGRALLKFCTVAKTYKRLPNARTLTQFVLPVASVYLCNESYASKNSIVDAAIETVGTVCRLLPWHHYEIILKHYLDKLGRSVEFQRQIVRILVAILDAFHYDLSKLKSIDAKISEVIPAQPEIEESETIRVDETEKDRAVENFDELEESLDEALDAIDEDADKTKDNSEKEETPEVPAIERQTILSQYAAKRLVFGIIHILLPKLHRSIVARTHHENSHKVNRRRTGAEREEEELGRVPIALAMVKLLQKLPEDILDRNLPGIFMKLCTFLKSRLDSVRRATREILQKIMTTLGPDYLHHLLREMNALLTKGFQIHVLAYTIHAVLVSLKPLFEERHMGENLQSIMSVCKIDLFGPTGEEKEVAAIAKNVSEARTTKSYDIFAIIGQYVAESCLLDVILPLREILAQTRSHATVRKAVECLRHFVLGLADNTFVPVERLVVFLYGVVSESIPELLPTKKPQLTEKESNALARQKYDCYLIAPVPKTRMGVKTTAKVSADTNAHVMTEFALKLLHILLKRERVAGSSFVSYLDPFVPILASCLNAKQVKLSTLALQCLNWILKMDLPTVRETVADVCSSIFGILHKYAAAGLGKGDNFDLVMASFKCMSVLVRDVKHFTMTNDQTKALVLYAEQDLHDSDKQATAFNLLKAVIHRKLIVPEMHAVMEKVATLSVTSELDHVRQQSRSVFYNFLMEYPLGKHLDKHIAFYLSQLSYDMKPGRLSALEMIHSIVTGFPVKVLEQQSAVLFFMVGARLINDEDPSCRKLSAKCIKETIQRVSHNQRVKLFDIVKLWLKDSKITHRTLAAQLCGIFVNVEKESFDTRLGEILPLVLKQFHAEDADNLKNAPGRFVISKGKSKTKRRNDFTNVGIKDPERMKDHHLFQSLQLCLKISANCPSLFKNQKHEDSVRSLAEYSQSLLGHAHLWVRLAATQMIGFILANLDEEKISRFLEDPKMASNEKGYLYSNPLETLKSLSLDLVAQLQPETELEELSDQVVKNLVFVARVMKPLTMKNSCEDEKNGRNVDISIVWLWRRLRKCINVEITQAPKSTSVRTAVFKWIAGVVATIPIDNLKPVHFQLTSPLLREITTTEESNAPLRHLAKEVAAMIKKSIGNDDYARLLAKVQQKLDIKRNERKNTRTQQLITDPELAAKRKIARQQKKKEAKKRRVTEARGKKRTLKKPRKEINLET